MKVAIRVGVLTVAAFFGGLGAWCATAPLDGAVIGSGALAVHGNRKTVQHREGGIVAELRVHDGTRVEQGELLVRLDDTQIRAALTVHQSQLLADQALSARDMAELSDADEITFPDSLSPDDPVAAAVMQRERIVFRNRRDLLARQLDVIDQRIAQARHQEAGARVQLAAASRQLSLAEDEQRAIAELERIGLASKNRLLELSRAVESLRGSVGQLSADVARLGAQAIELAAEKLRLREVSQADATRELREAQLRINDVLPRLVADRDLLNRLEIRAPMAGEVVNLTIFTKGGVVEPGRPILDIVPADRTIVAEAEIRPEDVEHLRIGQAAEVVAVGFNPRENPPLQGEVRIISADRVTDGKTGRSFFKAEIALVGDRQGGALLSRLSPGMPVEVGVPVAPRTALDYLISPLRESFRGALREL
ncbi:MAG: HlyD family type I secretion periplasmic adaptor subunit [Rhodospirillales bacterium]|nr:HlyD family type I secretion periplasmic adaptor subunit [Rhodospirillales bacterium]